MSRSFLRQTYLIIRVFAWSFFPLLFESVKNDFGTSTLHATDEALEATEFEGTAVGYSDLVDESFWC
jgi:hypothetical protein